MSSYNNIYIYIYIYVSSLYYCGDHGHDCQVPQRILGGLTAPRQSWLWAIRCVFQVCVWCVHIESLSGSCGVWATRVANSYNLGSCRVVSVLLATLLLKTYSTINICHNKLTGGFERGGLEGAQAF